MPVVRQFWHANVCKIWSKCIMWYKSYEHILLTDTYWQKDNLDRPKWCSAKPHHHFANHWLIDNVKINNYAKFDLNIPCGSRVISIFIYSAQPARLMLSKASSIKKGCNARQWLDNVDMHSKKKYKYTILDDFRNAPPAKTLIYCQILIF